MSKGFLTIVSVFLLVAYSRQAPAEHAGDANRLKAELRDYKCEDRAKAEAMKWAKNLASVAAKSRKDMGKPGIRTTPGGLIDSTKFLSKETLSDFARIENKGGEGVKLFVSDKPDQSFVNVSIGGEAWHLSESPWYRDQHPDGLPRNRRRLVLRSLVNAFEKDKVSKVHEFPLTEVLNGNTFDFGKLKELAAEATRNLANEARDEAGMANYDLPKDRKIGYIGLVPKGTDVITDGIREDVEQFPTYLSCKGYDFTGFPKRSIAHVNGDPAEILRRLVRDYKVSGIDTVYINAASHGDYSGIHFGVGSGESVVLTPDQLTGIYNEFPDMKFITDTVACHAGGIGDSMKNYRDPSGETGRVTAFLQTKGTGLNQEGRILGKTEPPPVLSSYYNIFRVAALENGKTFGAAHLEADKFAKVLIPSDAEAYRSSPNGGRVTKGFGR